MSNDSPIPTIQPAYDGAPLDEQSRQDIAKKHGARSTKITFLARLRRGWRGAPRAAEQLPIERRGQVWSILGVTLVFGAGLYVLWMFLGGI